MKCKKNQRKIPKVQEHYSASGQFWHDKWLSCLFFSLQLTPPLIWQRCLYVALFVSLKLTSIQALIVSTQLPGLGPKSVKALLLFDAQKQALKILVYHILTHNFLLKRHGAKMHQQGSSGKCIFCHCLLTIHFLSFMSSPNAQYSNFGSFTREIAYLCNSTNLMLFRYICI